MIFDPWGWMGHVGFEGVGTHEEDEVPGRSGGGPGLPGAPSGDWPPQSAPPPWGQTLPVQMESCNLSVVSLKINEVEEVLGRLFISQLSGRKESRPGLRPQLGA